MATMGLQGCPSNVHVVGNIDVNRRCDGEGLSSDGNHSGHWVSWLVAGGWVSMTRRRNASCSSRRFVATVTHGNLSTGGISVGIEERLARGLDDVDLPRR